MHLIKLGDLLQELSGKGSESTVIEHGVTRKTEAIHILWGEIVCSANMEVHSDFIFQGFSFYGMFYKYYSNFDS